MRLIDADALKENMFFHEIDNVSYAEEKDIDNTPTVDAVVVVRCKDCKNWIPGYITDNDDFIPPKCGKYQQIVGHYSDDYCSLAERRSE